MLTLTTRSKEKFIEFAKNVLDDDVIPESFFSVIENWKLSNPRGRVFFIEKEWTTCQCTVPYLFTIYDWYDKPCL
jgi:hypothetical protein